MPKPPEFHGNMHRKLPELSEWTKKGNEPALEPELPIVDPHHHLWDDSHRGQYLLDDLCADLSSGHNIVSTVFIETALHYRTDLPVAMAPLGEVEFVNSVAAEAATRDCGKFHPCAGIVGHADLTLGDGAAPVLDALIAVGGGRFRGIRHGVPWDTGDVVKLNRRKGSVPRYQLLDPKFREGFRHLQARDLTFEAWLFYHQLEDLADLLHAFPQTYVILNHIGGMLGIPPHDDKRDEIFAAWRKHLRELAQFDNVCVKVGGLGSIHCGWDFHMREVPASSEELAAAWRPYVETCIETFSPDRCMLESNFPPDKQSCGYGVVWNTFKRITKGCSQSEKALLYRDTAARVYRLKVGK